MVNPTNETLNKMNGATREVKSKIQGAEAQLEKMAHEAGEKIEEMASDLANTTSGYVKSGRDYVQENPGKSIALAAATGFIVGGLASLVLRKRR